MNDRFKFRVWNDTHKQYLRNVDVCVIDDVSQLYCAFDGGTIEQCTGLKDKNGNLIYEGDIVRDSLLGRKYTVKWDCDNVQFEATANVYDTEFSEVYGLYVDSAKELEIIGNIHEKRIQNDSFCRQRKSRT